MGQLKSNLPFVYERIGNTMYSCKSGDDPDTRTEIGYDYETFEERRDHNIRAGMRQRHEALMEAKLWGDIRREAKTNPTLHDALENAIMIYHLTKTK
jgi:hypothetical protein